MPQIHVDPEKCNRCGACVAVCNSAKVFVQTDQAVRAADIENCWLCGHCVAVCPTDAIEHSRFALDDCPQVASDALPSVGSLTTAFRARRSTRMYKRKPVPREVVSSLIDAARWVPSANNAQSVDWLIFDDPDRIAALSRETVAAFDHQLQQESRQTSPADDEIEDIKRLVQQQDQGRDPIFFKAPVLLLAHVPVENIFGRDDATYAVYNLILAAERIGLGSCLIGYFIMAIDSSRSLKYQLNLPPGRRLEVALIIGYPQFKFRRAVPRRSMEIIWNPMPK